MALPLCEQRLIPVPLKPTGEQRWLPFFSPVLIAATRRFPIAMFGISIEMLGTGQVVNQLLRTRRVEPGEYYVTLLSHRVVKENLHFLH